MIDPGHAARRAILAMSLMFGGTAAAFGQAQPAAPASAPSGAPAQASTAPARIEPKAQQFLDRAIQALGGAAFLNFQTVTTHGRLFSISGQSEGLVYFDSQVQFPDKRRLSYGISMKARPIVVINNGDLGWEIDRMGMVHQGTAEVRQWKFATRYNLENLLRLRIHEPGTLVQSAGVDFVNNLPVDILQIVDAQQTQIKLCLNKQSGLPVEITYRKWNAEANDWDEYADDYADFRTFQGIGTAMHITRTVNGRRFTEIYRNAVTYNETYPPKVFEDPGAG
ncbi:MAG TPA: hypothetical protein VG860_20080 [Terriglobia bacterium]|nr:hypothetical protein [Terriglobia bacterium]